MELQSLSSGINFYHVKGDEAQAQIRQWQKKYQTPKVELGGRTLEDTITFVDKDKTRIAYEPFKVDTEELADFVMTGPDRQQLREKLIGEKENKSVKSMRQEKLRMALDSLKGEQFRAEKPFKPPTDGFIPKATDVVHQEYKTTSDLVEAINTYLKTYSPYSDNPDINRFFTKLASAANDEVFHGWGDEILSRAGRSALFELRSADLLQQVEPPRTGALAQFLDTHKVAPFIREPLESLVKTPEGLWAQLTDLGMNVSRKLKYIL